MYLSLATVVARLILLTLGGFLVFRHPQMQRRLYPPALFLTLNILFPLFFVHRLPTGWEAALSAGWWWMVGFFILGLGTLGTYALLARRLAPRMRPEQPRQWTLLFAVHNAGFIPLPILDIFAPEAVTIYMFFYLLAFNLTFWTVVAGMVQREGGGQGKLFTVNPPLVGILIGLLLAVTGVYDLIPQIVKLPIRAAEFVALDAALFILGGALAGIPKEDLRIRAEFIRFSLVRLAALPGVVLLIMALPFWQLIPIFARNEELLWGIRLVLVLEAATPPATNSMIATRAYGTERQLHYTAGGIINSYLFSALSLPLFLALTLALFYPA
ncbi:MAG: AEC family transporter [Alkalispirochaetaceae bacterium]